MVSKESNHSLVQCTNSNQDKTMTVRSVLLNRDSPDIESRLKRRRNRTQQVRFKDLVDGSEGACEKSPTKEFAKRPEINENCASEPVGNQMAKKNCIWEPIGEPEKNANCTSMGRIQVSRRNWCQQRPCSLTLPNRKKVCMSTAIQTSPSLQKQFPAFRFRSKSVGDFGDADDQDQLAFSDQPQKHTEEGGDMVEEEQKSFVSEGAGSVKTVISRTSNGKAGVPIESTLTSFLETKHQSVTQDWHQKEKGAYQERETKSFELSTALGQNVSKNPIERETHCLHDGTAKTAVSKTSFRSTMSPKHLQKYYCYGGKSTDTEEFSLYPNTLPNTFQKDCSPLYEGKHNNVNSHSGLPTTVSWDTAQGDETNLNELTPKSENNRAQLYNRNSKASSPRDVLPDQKNPLQKDFSSKFHQSVYQRSLNKEKTQDHKRPESTVLQKIPHDAVQRDRTLTHEGCYPTPNSHFTVGAVNSPRHLTGEMKSPGKISLLPTPEKNQTAKEGTTCFKPSTNNSSEAQHKVALSNQHCVGHIDFTDTTRSPSLNVNPSDSLAINVSSQQSKEIDLDGSLLSHLDSCKLETSKLGLHCKNQDGLKNEPLNNIQHLSNEVNALHFESPVNPSTHDTGIGQSKNSEEASKSESISIKPNLTVPSQTKTVVSEISPGSFDQLGASCITKEQSETLKQVQDLLELVNRTKAQVEQSKAEGRLVSQGNFHQSGDLDGKRQSQQVRSTKHEISNMQTRLQAMEDVLETSKQTIKVLLDVIQDLEKKDALRDGRHSYRTGQDIANCGTCQDCACIIYSVEHDFRQQEGRFQRVLSIIESDSGQSSSRSSTPSKKEESPVPKQPAKMESKRSKRKCFWFL